MPRELSTEAQVERDGLIAEIHRAFQSTSRRGGMSWSECVVADEYGSEEELRAARVSDKDTHWSELVDDLQWWPFPGTGGFAFIDEKGFKYYLPPTMIRLLRGADHEWFPGHLLSFLNRYAPWYGVHWPTEQLRCIARFVQFMSKHDEDQLGGRANTAWSEGLKAGWAEYL